MDSPGYRDFSSASSTTSASSMLGPGSSAHTSPSSRATSASPPPAFHRLSSYSRPDAAATLGRPAEIGQADAATPAACSLGPPMAHAPSSSTTTSSLAKSPLSSDHGASFTASTASASSFSTSSAVSESSAGGGDEDGFNPPNNFAEVAPGLYRSSFPREKHWNFIRTLGLKMILTFVQEEYPEENLDFFADEGITFKQIPMPGNKEDDLRIPDSSIEEALATVLNPDNYPMLLHCNKGKHRTGVIVGCMRKIQGWQLDHVLEEYRHYSFPKCRTSDQHCISRFGIDKVAQQAAFTAPSWMLREHSQMLKVNTSSVGCPPNSRRPLHFDSSESASTTHSHNSQDTMCIPEGSALD